MRYFVSLWYFELYIKGKPYSHPFANVGFLERAPRTLFWILASPFGCLAGNSFKLFPRFWWVTYHNHSWSVSYGNRNDWSPIRTKIYKWQQNRTTVQLVRFVYNEYDYKPNRKRFLAPCLGQTRQKITVHSW